MKCPVCEQQDLAMSRRHEIEIDYCPHCRGVWLDRGELEKIIDRAASMEPPAAPPQPGSSLREYEAMRHLHSHSHHKKPLWHHFLKEVFEGVLG